MKYSNKKQEKIRKLLARYYLALLNENQQKIEQERYLFFKAISNYKIKNECDSQFVMFYSWMIQKY